MKIESRLMLADEISLHDAAALMVGIENPTAVDSAHSSRVRYDHKYDQYNDIDYQRRMEYMHEEIAELDDAIKQGRLFPRRNPDGGKWGDILNKEQWVLWLSGKGKYQALVEALRNVETLGKDNGIADVDHLTSLSDTSEIDCNETGIHIGRNKRATLVKWVDCMANRLNVKGDTTTTLAEKIVKAARGRILPERADELTVENVLRMLPITVTGGRAKNGRRSDNMRRLEFENEKKTKRS